ncbi:hypothetical protein SDC9_147143 [bioreactor metagenome]|uniref:Uncharacterized protein n=1 Tax=bioreactor metagenome TaxID=1076179 RepID=A0A645EFQ6_9ZZZZ
MRDSICLLLSTLWSTFVQKSAKLVNLPLVSLAFTISAITFVPTFFTAASPKRIFPFCTVNLSRLSLTSGGSISIPNLLHSLMYSETVPELPMMLEIKAAMNSTG